MSDFDSCQSNRTHMDGLQNWKANQVVQDLLWHLTSAYMKCVYGWAGVRYVITKFSRMDSLQNFVSHGALLRALRERESSAKKCRYISWHLGSYQWRLRHKLIPCKELFILFYPEWLRFLIAKNCTGYFSHNFCVCTWGYILRDSVF